MGNILITEVNMVSSNSDSLERNEKQKEYIDYLETHIHNVKVAYEKYFVPLLYIDHIDNLTKVSQEEFKNAIIEAKNNIEIHDASKYDDEEFNGYRLHFHATKSEKEDPNYEKIEKEMYYFSAWPHHYKNNPHHPLYWVNQETKEIKDMDLVYIIEMLCDWYSFNIKFGSSTKDWYSSDEAKDEKEEMSARTKEIVEEILFEIIRV
jgi:hypothetical protein